MTNSFFLLLGILQAYILYGGIGPMMATLNRLD